MKIGQFESALERKIKKVKKFFKKSKVNQSWDLPAKVTVVDVDNVKNSGYGSGIDQILKDAGLEGQKSFVNCPECDTKVTPETYKENFNSCPGCGDGETLNAYKWLECVLDPDSSYELLEEDLSFRHIKDKFFSDRERVPYKVQEYLEKLTRYEKKSKEELKKEVMKEGLKKEAIEEAIQELEELEIKNGKSNAAAVLAKGEIGGKPVYLYVSNMKFKGGTLGSTEGELFVRGANQAIKDKAPYISICSSGGARMEEGTLALLQMAKANLAVNNIRKQGIKYISVLAHPSTGGSLASYATQSDTIIAEKKALIAFAGPRVVELAGMKLDKEATTSDFFFEQGGVDRVVTRKDMNKVLAHEVKEFYNITRGAQVPARQ